MIFCFKICFTVKRLINFNCMLKNMKQWNLLIKNIIAFSVEVSLFYINGGLNFFNLKF